MTRTKDKVHKEHISDRKMEHSWIDIQNIPTKLITLGQNVSQKPKKIILIIPGNPGIASFYEDFMVSLKNQIDENYSIWTIAHSGQEVPPDSMLPKISENPKLFDLKAQIQYKIDFISNYIDKNEQEIFLIGHSIGCKMILDTMDANVGNIKAGYLLFPTIQDMKISPAGQKNWILIHHIPKLVVFLVWLLTWIPQNALKFLIKSFMNLTSSTTKLSDASLRGILDLINPTSVENMLYLAHTELEDYVLAPDYDQIIRLKDRLRFYYGTVDAWVPIKYYEAMIANVPGIQTELCQRKIPHAFVLSSSEIMATIVASWFNN